VPREQRARAIDWDRSADHIRARSQNGCIQRPNTWLHPNDSRKGLTLPLQRGRRPYMAHHVNSRQRSTSGSGHLTALRFVGVQTISTGQKFSDQTGLNLTESQISGSVPSGAAWATRERRGESGHQSPSHRCNRVRNVAFRPQRRILWAGNLCVRQIAGTAWWHDLLRGE
jgi:hypothetical protein